MAILDTDLQKKIDDLRFSANAFFRTDKGKYFQLKQDAWNLYPIPKNQWNESYNLAKDFFKIYVHEGDWGSAKNWLNEMIDINNNLHHMDTDLLFNIGKYYFEMGDLTEARNKFEDVVKESGLRYFERENPKYLDFYKNSDKYLSK